MVQLPEIEVFDWPPKSLDLNLIENVWGAIVNLWDCSHERTKENLVAHARNIWKGLKRKPEYFEILSGLVEKRLHQVIVRKRYWTDY